MSFDECCAMSIGGHVLPEAPATYCPFCFIEFHGYSTNVNCGSDASLDDLPDAELTIDGWISADSMGGAEGGVVISKRGPFIGPNSIGFDIGFNGSNQWTSWVGCAVTSAIGRLDVGDMPTDGLWHHFTVYWNDAGDRKIYLGIDGQWAAAYDLQQQAAGAYLSDAIYDCCLGYWPTLVPPEDAAWEGRIGWVRLSSNDRFSHGIGTTYDVPLRCPKPTVDANTIELWTLEECSGETVAASVVAANDGTLEGGNWNTLPRCRRCWLEYNGTTTEIDCGNDASLRDIHSDDFTLDGWIRPDSYGENNSGHIISKRGNLGNVGWQMNMSSINGLQGVVYYATFANSTSGLDECVADGFWYHVTMFYNHSGDRKIYLAVNGIWVASYGTQAASNGAISSDAAVNLIIGNEASGVRTFDGGIGWLRLTEGERFTVGANFLPPPRCPYPVVDDDTIELWRCDEGAYTILRALVYPTLNNGTISNGTWDCDP